MVHNGPIVFHLNYCVQVRMDLYLGKKGVAYITMVPRKIWCKYIRLKKQIYMPPNNSINCVLHDEFDRCIRFEPSSSFPHFDTTRTLIAQCASNIPHKASRSATHKVRKLIHSSQSTLIWSSNSRSQELFPWASSRPHSATKSNRQLPTRRRSTKHASKAQDAEENGRENSPGGGQGS